MREKAQNLPDFTLMTSDCMGGLIYHTLGRKFLSPTINMSIKDTDFLKLVSDEPYYYSLPINFVPYNKYPIGYIGEGSRKIELRFEHYNSADSAQRKWNERKQRVCENRFIIMADQNLNDTEIAQFKALKVTRKLMFTWNPERDDGQEIFYIKSYGKSVIKNYSKLNPNGFRDYEIFFDFVAWLGMKNDFMLE